MGIPNRIQEFEVFRNKEAILGHKHKETNKVKDAQQIVKNQQLPYEMLKNIIEVCSKNGTSIDALDKVCSTICWHSLKKDDTMNNKLNHLINTLLSDEKCYKILKFNENEISNIWLILKDETYEDLIKYTTCIERFIASNELNIEYMIFNIEY